PPLLGSVGVWGLFAVCVALMTAYLLRHDPALVERRMAVGAGAEPTRRQKVILALGAPVLCAVFVVAGLHHRFGWSSVPLPIVLAADVEANQRVISSGPYACVRHPMYAGGAVCFLATPLALGSLWALVPAILLCAALVARLLDEERYLSERLA